LVLAVLVLLVLAEERVATILYFPQLLAQVAVEQVLQPILQVLVVGQAEVVAATLAVLLAVLLLQLIKVLLVEMPTAVVEMEPLVVVVVLLR
jgi:hypothetical protein